MKLTREIKAAILVITSLLLFIWGYNFLKGKDLFENYKTLYVEYDNVEGLSPSALVTVNGLSIGKVNSININPKTGKLLVKLKLNNNDFPISKSSIACIYEAGIIGGKQIAIVPNFKDINTVENGDYLKGSVKLGTLDSFTELIEPMQVKIDTLLTNINSLVSSLNNVLDKKAQADIKNSLAELSKTIEQIHKASNTANLILDENKVNMKGIVTDFKTVSKNFTKVSDSLAKVDFNKTVKNLNGVLNNLNTITYNLEKGKGTAGKLLTDEALYNNFSKTSKELELLLQDLRLYPTRYVNISLFGKKNKPYVSQKQDSIAKLKK